MVKNQAVSKSLSVFLLASVVLTALVNIHVVYKNLLPVTVIGACIALLACAIAVFYAVKGYRKDAAKYYKLYMITVFLDYQLAACTAGIRLTALHAGILVAVHCLIAAFALTLTLSNDLGKKVSMTLCWSMLGIAAAITIAALIGYPGIARGGDVGGTIAAFRTGSNCFLAEVALLMTKAKYQDKAARNTK